MTLKAEYVPDTLPEDEHETRPMTDAEHRRVFGWSWDDPDGRDGDA